jgi:hypothetical protein
LAAKADSTCKKYIASWNRWESWAASKTEIKTFPVEPFHFSLYISHLAVSGHKSVAESAAAAVKWVHNLVGLPSPTDNNMVKLALLGFKRMLSAPPLRKEPITPDILHNILAAHGHPRADLADLRVLFVCFISYAGFLRFDDISSVTRRDCIISADRMTIRLRRSKTDQFRQGADVVIARTFKATCPVVIAERYFSAMGDPPGFDAPRAP